MRDVEAARIRGALEEHGAVVLRGVALGSPACLVDIATSIGTPRPVAQRAETSLVQMYESSGGRRTALKSDEWHSDNAYLARPAYATCLYALDLPAHATVEMAGLETMLCDAAAAYDALDAPTRHLISGLDAEHCNVTAAAAGSAKPPPPSARLVNAVHPIVRAHPRSGRPALYVSPAYTTRLLRDGVPLPPTEGPPLLQRLLAHLLEPRFCAAFRWQGAGDLLLWDNARVLHRATTSAMPPGSSRRMLRVSIAGEPPRRYEAA